MECMYIHSLWYKVELQTIHRIHNHGVGPFSWLKAPSSAFMKVHASTCFQPGECPSRGLLRRDCENRWIVCSSNTKSCYSRYNPAVESITNTPPQWSACDSLPGFPPRPRINRRGVTIQLSLSPYHQSRWPQSAISCLYFLAWAWAMSRQLCVTKMSPRKTKKELIFAHFLALIWHF